MACGVRPGDEVLVPVQTFIATGMAPHNIGARPVFCDIRLETLCIDPAELERRGSVRTRAVIVVHYGGLVSPDLPTIRELCKRKGWALIEDAAHAHGAALAGRPAGSLADAACFSYYPTKILTTGEGGMITTDRDDLAARCRSFQARGQDLDLSGEQFARPYGRNVRVPELSALLGVLQYGHLAEFVERRRAVAAVYDRMLSGEPGLFIPPVPAQCRHSYWLYTVLLPAGTDRVRLQWVLRDDWDIHADWSYFPPLHLMPVFRELFAGAPSDCPVAEDALDRLFNLPVHPFIDPADAERVAGCFLHELRRLRP